MTRGPVDYEAALRGEEKPGIWVDQFGDPPWDFEKEPFLERLHFSQGIAAFNVERDECVILNTNGKFDFMLNGRYLASSLDDIKDCLYSPILEATVLVANKGGNLLIITANNKFTLLGDDCFEFGKNLSYPSYFFVTFDKNYVYGFINDRLEVKVRKGLELPVYIDVVPKNMKGIWLVCEGPGVGRIYYGKSKMNMQIKGIESMEHHTDGTVSLMVESIDGKRGRIKLV